MAYRGGRAGTCRLGAPAVEDHGNVKVALPSVIAHRVGATDEQAVRSFGLVASAREKNVPSPAVGYTAIALTLASATDPPGAMVIPPAPGHTVPSGSGLPGMVRNTVLPVTSNGSRPQQMPVEGEQSRKVKVPASGVVQSGSAHASSSRMVPESLAGTSCAPSGGVSVEVLNTRTTSCSVAPVLSVGCSGNTAIDQLA